MANSLQENHAKGDVLININLPRGNVDFSLTESSNGLCVAGQLPAAASAATSASTEDLALDWGMALFSSQSMITI